MSDISQCWEVWGTFLRKGMLDVPFDPVWTAKI